ncbi:MAG: DUF2723 domain-containing protein [Prevotellaceae bacterium]|nr:DUF2723 domain-containing protein [Prevotellaceae bacterium]
MNFKQLNNSVGWLCFAVAAATYLCTMEPTASLWDCGEFIATSYKLEVGHPPGAPLFMLVSRIFALLAGGNAAHVAVMVNAMSALCSAFTILFLFWSITHIARKLTSKKSPEKSPEKGKPNHLPVLAAGFVGAMAYTFSDTFWFSAVEGEVYAMSSLFTAVVFWAMLKWEGEERSDLQARWIVLIAYLMGLSIGVHLLNLLAIPAIVMIYYFKRYKFSWLGALKALAASAAILLAILYGVIPGVVVMASWVELLFVNTLHAPYNSGALFFLLVVVASVIFGVYYTCKRGKKSANAILVCLAVMLMGYSSYAVVVIRSAANPPIDENSPDNVFNLKSYLNREQYGDRPLLVGPSYATPVVDYAEIFGYIKKNGRYERAPSNLRYTYNERYTMLFPRMYSPSTDHVEEYKKWGDVRGRRTIVRSAGGEQEAQMMPTFAENLRFFFTYQLGHMYLRYFMWNFAGRQNDIQSHGGVLHGRWISGIPFIDNLMLGNQQNLPTFLEQNKARNKYYMLPLALGVVGLLFQLRQSKKSFTIVGLLFFFTGAAIVVYLNQTPLQPRERDYAYAGSFYAFAIWIGLGALCFSRWLAAAGAKRASGSRSARRLLTAIGCLLPLLAPAIMAKENWDDHDRSQRYFTRDFAYCYLASCAPNAILFTGGDNDTFPLWYLQEVEGVRTDVRVVNLSLLGADWYIGQMKMRAYQSSPLPMNLPQRCYEQGVNEEIYVVDKIQTSVPLRQAIDFVASESPQTKLRSGHGQPVSYLPSRQLSLEVNREGDFGVADEHLPLPDSITFSISREVLFKSDLAALDIIAANRWERPVYFSSVGSSSDLGLSEYLQFEGFTYRLIPYKTSTENMLSVGRMEPDTLYRRLLHTYRYGNIDRCNVPVDEHVSRALSMVRFREIFTRTANALSDAGKAQQAAEVLHRCAELMPTCSFPINSSQPEDIFYLTFIEAFYRAGLREEANAMAETFYEETQKNLLYFFGLPRPISRTLDYEREVNLHFLQNLASICKEHQELALSEKYRKEMLNFE